MCGSPTRRPLLRKFICEFVRVASDYSELVGRACHGSTMETRHVLQGIELRYACTMYLLQHGPTTVDEVIKALEWQGFEIRGRASKKVSDALRWERRGGRGGRPARGPFRPRLLSPGPGPPVLHPRMDLSP